MTIRLFESNLPSWRAELEIALGTQLDAMDLPRHAFLPFIDADGTPLPDRSVVLYFSDGTHTPDATTLASIEAHVQAGRTIIPVVDTVVGATHKLPEVLHPFNACAIGETQRSYGPLVDEIITRVWLLRPVRKLFLSYRRAESSAIAHQLRDTFTRRGYEVFLDECTLPPGTLVQHELMRWLEDADFVLLLATPDLQASTWVLREIGAAGNMLLPILGICWPGAEKIAPIQSLMPDQVFRLDGRDFVDASAALKERELTVDAIGRLLSTLHAFRTAAVAQRLWNLVPLAVEELRNKAKKASSGALNVVSGEQPFDLKLLVQIDSTITEYVRVVPFRPTIETVHDLHSDLRKGPEIPEAAYLFYQENHPNDRRYQALAWALFPARPPGDEGARRYGLMPFVR
jgi:hypothetical protein